MNTQHTQINLYDHHAQINDYFRNGNTLTVRTKILKLTEIRYEQSYDGYLKVKKFYRSDLRNPNTETRVYLGPITSNVQPQGCANSYNPSSHERRIRRDFNAPQFSAQPTQATSRNRATNDNRPILKSKTTQTPPRVMTPTKSTQAPDKKTSTLPEWHDDIWRKNAKCGAYSARVSHTLVEAPAKADHGVYQSPSISFIVGWLLAGIQHLLGFFSAQKKLNEIQSQLKSNKQLIKTENNAEEVKQLFKEKKQIKSDRSIQRWTRFRFSLSFVSDVGKYTEWAFQFIKKAPVALTSFGGIILGAVGLLAAALYIHGLYKRVKERYLEIQLSENSASALHRLNNKRIKQSTLDDLTKMHEFFKREKRSKAHRYDFAGRVIEIAAFVGSALAGICAATAFLGGPHVFAAIAVIAGPAAGIVAAVGAGLAISVWIYKKVQERRFEKTLKISDSNYLNKKAIAQRLAKQISHELIFIRNQSIQKQSLKDLPYVYFLVKLGFSKNKLKELYVRSKSESGLGLDARQAKLETLLTPWINRFMTGKTSLET
jgi:hypothetical protein